MKRVLIVDDDSRVLSLTRRWLAEAGYQVMTASNFPDARAEITLQTPDLVVADVRLGDHNGIQLGILAREARPMTRVVIMSGHDDPVLQRDIKQLEATFIRKPFRSNTLLRAVHRIVSR